MDKNTITGFLLIAAVVIGFSIYSRPSEEQQAERKQQLQQDSIRQEQAELSARQRAAADTVKDVANSEKDKVSNFFAQQTVENKADSIESSAKDTNAVVAKSNLEEKIVSLQNEHIKIDFSTKGGHMVSSQLKGYKTYQGDSLYLFNTANAQLSLVLKNKTHQVLDTKDALFIPIQASDTSLVMRLNYSDSQYIDFVYTLGIENFMVKFDILAVGMKDLLDRESTEKFQLVWKQSLTRKEKNLSGEQRYSHIHYKIQGSDVEQLSESKDEQVEVTVPVKWVAFKDQFFATTLIADYNFDISNLSSQMRTSEEYLKDYSAMLFVPVSTESDGSLKAGFRYFMGPLNYSMLKGYDDNVTNVNDELDLDKLIPLGWGVFRWVNQYFVIPLFNLLSKTGWSMGLIILLLTVIVKIIISPLTYKSFLSSAKMRVLRPQVEELTQKFPKQEQMQERQQATMKLYSSAGVNPMSGCIPMLLQMPILLALFSFFPSAIELRQESFLWAEDLSTYDAVITWTSNIPLLSSWLGNHLSIFCILMTVTNIVYTKFNMDATNTGQQQMPGMKWMMYLMPLVFLFVLNNYPSGLTYYYFLSTLITIILTIAFRYAIDEEKLLLKLEENKKKPKKKSGFMARLEEAQKIQEQQKKAKGKQNKKK